MTRIPFDPETIRSLAAILKEEGLTELSMQEGEQRLHLVRGGHAAPAVPGPAGAGPAVPPPLPAAPVGASPAEEAPPAGAVTSPMVGIAYLSPEPGAPAYVSVGQAVAAGQTLLLIEAMKTFNQIKAPRAGTVTQVLVQPGAPVEYGQPLMVIG